MSPLTEPQRREAHRAKLEGLVADLAEARRSGDDPRTTMAKEALFDFNSPYGELNQEAENALNAANLADLNAAVAEFARIANRIGQESGEVRSGLERARTAAESGKKELLIPRIAETSSKALAELKELKEGIDKFINQAGQADDLDQVLDLLPQAIDQLEGLRQAAKNVGIDLH